MLVDDFETETQSTNWNVQVFEHVYQRAQAGDTACQFQLGEFFSGKHNVVAANPKKQVEWYQIAANRGHPGAMNNLGLLYEKGQGVEKSGIRAFELFNKTLEHQSLEPEDRSISLFNVGRCHHYGIGVAKNINMAFDLYSRAAELGHQRANYQCGVFLQTGLTGRADSKRAFPYLKKAAELGHTQASYSVGTCLHYGIGTEKSDSFIDWYLKAANSGHARANLAMAELYEKGRDVPGDRDKAIYYLKRAATYGDSAAKYQLYEKIRSGTLQEPDADRIRSLLEQSAEAGFKDAIYELVLCLQNGDLFEKDIDRALNLIERPVLDGDCDAYLIFRCIGNVDLTPEQKNTHRRITKLSADLFNPSAAYDLAKQYEEDGDIESGEEAIRYYSRAAALGVYGAALDLARCFRHGIGYDEASPREAAAIYYHHAFVVNTHGYSHIFRLAECFANGIAVPKNYVIAYALSNFAGANGDEDGSALRDSLESKMSQEQIGKAQNMTMAWGDLSDIKDCNFFPEWMREPPEYTQLEEEARAKEQKDPEREAKAAKALLKLFENIEASEAK